MRRGKNYIEERQKRILDMVAKQGSVSVEKLSNDFGISPSTVRKLLNDMSERGLLSRSFGGALANRAPVDSSGIKNYNEKLRIAELARSYIEEGDIIAIGAGTTTALLATQLRDMKNLTVVTNSIIVAVETMRNPNIETRICGGVVRMWNGATYDSDTESFFKGILADKAFISPDSVTVGFGFGDLSAYVAFSQRAIISCSRNVFVLADHTKMGLTTCTDRIAAFGDVDHLITNQEIDPAQLASLRRTNISILLA